MQTGLCLYLQKNRRNICFCFQINKEICVNGPVLVVAASYVAKIGDVRVTFRMADTKDGQSTPIGYQYSGM